MTVALIGMLEVLEILTKSRKSYARASRPVGDRDGLSRGE
jgi:hypothetical protein